MKKVKRRVHWDNIRASPQSQRVDGSHKTLVLIPTNTSSNRPVVTQLVVDNRVANVDSFQKTLSDPSSGRKSGRYYELISRISLATLLVVDSQVANGPETADEEPVDPKRELEDRCKAPCTRPLKEYQACVKRIQGDESGQKHCTGQYFDYWRCVDKCRESFRFLSKNNTPSTIDFQVKDKSKVLTDDVGVSPVFPLGYLYLAGWVNGLVKPPLEDKKNNMNIPPGLETGSIKSVNHRAKKKYIQLSSIRGLETGSIKSVNHRAKKKYIQLSSIRGWAKDWPIDLWSAHVIYET
ncbi:cytochrome b-c1 complex subunit 6 [Phtheirospermum japonicum]|uniref:Complex III subunit VI n=1 Tax=Phtheirospermum japonicum TaxID=374723 RepID=A0A830CUG0_9LAMI|nr:cytochrome b-c1 complex subunit 6 [Phtheirospermum japonicum]